MYKYFLEPTLDLSTEVPENWTQTYPAGGQSVVFWAPEEQGRKANFRFSLGRSDTELDLIKLESIINLTYHALPFYFPQAYVFSEERFMLNLCPTYLRRFKWQRSEGENSPIVIYSVQAFIIPAKDKLYSFDAICIEALADKYSPLFEKALQSCRFPGTPQPDLATDTEFNHWQSKDIWTDLTPHHTEWTNKVSWI